MESNINKHDLSLIPQTKKIKFNEASDDNQQSIKSFFLEKDSKIHRAFFRKKIFCGSYQNNVIDRRVESF